MLSALRAGSFVTRERIVVYSWLLLAGYLIGIVALLVTSDGLVDALGRPLGTDFANVYSAGRMALDGQPAAAYDWPTHHAVQKAISGREDIPYFGWHYPPVFLLIAAPLALLPYLAALVVYQSLTLAAYLVSVRQIAGRADAWLPALAFTAVFVNVTHGHNGFITAVLLGGALLVLDRRPVLAGVLIGCLVYKPQFGLMIPLVLMLTGRWRVFAAASVTVIALVGLTTAVFGLEVWTAFRQSLELTQKIILEQGATGYHKFQSVFGAVRLLGGSITLAYAAQVAAILGVAGTLALLWRSAADYELKAAGLILGCLIATPYALDYDLVVLAPAIAFLVVRGLRRGFEPYLLTLLVVLWVLPLPARLIAEATYISLGPIFMLAAFALVLRAAGIFDGPRAPAVLAAQGRSSHG